MPQNKYQQVHTEDTDTESSSHSRTSSNGGMEPSTVGDTAVVPASNLPTTYSSQQLISGSSEDVGDKECVQPQRPSVNQDDTTAVTVPKKHMFTVVVLCFINLINYMDRFTIAGKSPILRFEEKNLLAYVHINFLIHEPKPKHTNAKYVETEKKR